jgi:murein peptide amidase A
MRWPCVFILLPLAACASAPELPTVPAPWESTENQLAEPSQPTEAGIPAWTKVGNSIRGKPIEAMTLGNGKKRIYIIGGLHGDEPEGPGIAAKLPGALLNDLTGDAGQNATVRILRDANPDGTALRTRGNTRGTDLNRNFPTRDFNPESLPGRRQGLRPASELEVTVLLNDLKAFKPDLVIVFRTAQLGRGPMVSFDGPGLTGAYDFASAARAEEPRWRVSTDKSFITTGSIDSLVAREMRRPVLSVEFRRGEEITEAVRAVRAGIMALTAGRTPAAAPKSAPSPAGTPAVREPVLGGRS